MSEKLELPWKSGGRAEVRNGGRYQTFTAYDHGILLSFSKPGEPPRDVRVVGDFDAIVMPESSMEVRTDGIDVHWITTEELRFATEPEAEEDEVDDDE